MNTFDLNPDKPITLNIEKEEERTVALEQYKLLITSLDNTNETRETSNTFWVTVNSVSLSALAYLRDTNDISTQKKAFLLWALIVIGIFLCFFWLSFLSTIKKTVDARNKVLMEIEKYFALPVFTKVYSLSDRSSKNSSLTVKEMLVPMIFIAGYCFFASLLYFFTDQVVNAE